MRQEISTVIEIIVVKNENEIVDFENQKLGYFYRSLKNTTT